MLRGILHTSLKPTSYFLLFNGPYLVGVARRQFPGRNSIRRSNVSFSMIDTALAPPFNLLVGVLLLGAPIAPPPRLASAPPPRLASASQTAEADARFRRLDTNNDGRLDRAELRAPLYFVRADKNRDGFLSPAEVAAADSGSGRSAPPGRGDNSRESLTVDGRKRTYILHAPTGLKTPAPLVFVFHGGGGDADKMTGLGFNELADRDKFIVVYPEAIEKNWNDGRNAAGIASQKQNVDDVKFIRELVEEVSKTQPVDRSRIFGTGASNGAIFSHWLAHHASDLFAGFAPVIGSIAEPLQDSFSPACPLSLLIIQGNQDKLIPINGGAVHDSGFRDRGSIIAANRTLEKYQTLNGIVGKPTISELPDNNPKDGVTVQVVTYPPGKGGVRLQYYLLKGGGHTWPGGKHHAMLEKLVGNTCQDFDGAEVIWKFFKTCPPRKK